MTLLDEFPIHDILNANINLDRTMADSGKRDILSDMAIRDGLVMPNMLRVSLLGIGRNWSSKATFRRSEIIAAVQVVVYHKLREILQMGFVRLELSLHDHTLLQQICEPCHNNRVEDVNLEKESVADMEAIEGNALDKGDPSNKLGIPRMLIATVANC